MSQKGGNFFEQHIEKIVLAAAGLACLFILVTRVIFSSAQVTFDNKKFLPSEIDSYIYNEHALRLEQMLNRSPDSSQSYKPKSPDFLAKIDSAISSVVTKLSLPLPIASTAKLIDNRTYPLPVIGGIRDVAVEHIRAVAYIPTQPVNDETPYELAENEPNDLDFISVEAKFDIAGLALRFRECFAGENVKPQWRDPCLAKPVFAAVELQRQQQLKDGAWTDWQTVPRAKIESSAAVLKVVENAGDLPVGGIKIRVLNFSDSLTQKNILQPNAYQIASAKEEWLPPTLHKKYVAQIKTAQTQERRDALATEKAEQERIAAERRARAATTRTRTTTSGGAGSDANPDANPDATPARPGGRTATPRTRDVETRRLPERRTPVPVDIFTEFEQMKITPATDFAKMPQPLVFWAHDDTAEPEQTYRYRIRLGLFNPVAGMGQVDAAFESQKNQVVLWSDFSDVTAAVTVPAKVYFFPTDIKEATKTVTVQVSKYVLGYWYSKEFPVKEGEVVGEIAATPAESNGVSIPQQIDFSTGMVMVDTIPVTDWAGTRNLTSRKYFNMLYTLGGFEINSMPIQIRNWTDTQRNMYNEIKKAEKEPKEPLRAWDTTSANRQRISTPASGTTSSFGQSQQGQGGGTMEQ